MKQIKIEIKPIKPSNLEDVANLYYQLSDQKTNITKMPDVFQQILKDRNYHLLGAFINNSLSGSIMCIICHNMVGECQPFMLVENVIVDQKYHHQGIGKQLMIKAELLAKHNNCSYLKLLSGMKRKDAHKFYESLGYSGSVTQGYKKRCENFAIRETSPTDYE